MRHSSLIAGTFALLCIGAAAAAVAPAGVYALVNGGGTGAWLARVLANGTLARVGPGGANASWAPGQGLAVLDAAAGQLLAVLGNERARNAPSLFAFDLATGDVASVLALPFVSGDTIGVGQLVALAPSPGEALVGGFLATGEQVIGAVDRTSGAFREIGRLNATTEEIAITCSRGALAVDGDGAHALLFGGLDPRGSYERLVLRLTLSGVNAGKLTRADNAASHRILTYSANARSGDIVGLGSRGDAEETIVVRLQPGNLTTAVIGAVPALSVSLDGLAALDAANNALVWVGAADADKPFFLVSNSLAPGAPEISRVQVCVSFEKCPLWSIDVFSPPAEGVT